MEKMANLNEPKWKLYLRSLFSRNIILCLLINCLNNYANKMGNAVRTVIGTSEIGMDVAVVGVLISVLTFVILFLRSPSGAIVDKLTSKIGKVIAVYMVIRVVLFAMFIFVNNAVLFDIIVVLDGCLNAMMAVAIPALLAISTPRAVIGGVYALYNGISNTVTGSARGAALGIYNSSGRASVFFVCIALAVVAVILALLLDGKKFDVSARQPAKKTSGGKGILSFYASGFHKALLPFCIFSVTPLVAWLCQAQYSQVWLQTTSFDYVAIDAIGGSLSGIMCIVAGFLADFINPAIIAAVSMAGHAAYALLTGVAETQGVFATALWIFYFSNQVYGTMIRIVCMKAVTKKEMGAVSSTIMFAYDIFSLLGNPIIAAGISKFTFQPTVLAVGVFEVIALVCYIVFAVKMLPKLKARAAEAEALEAAEAAAASA